MEGECALGNVSTDAATEDLTGATNPKQKKKKRKGKRKKEGKKKLKEGRKKKEGS